MAQLAFSVVGAAVGFYFGGPTGAQVGWAAGSLIGGALAPDQEGPRLSDSKVQISSYGAAVGIAYGGVRKAGNVVWSTDLVESEQGGGKGGPSVTVFTYSASCAIAIVEGPIGGIRRIWADAKLVYDLRETADDTVRAASAQFAQYMTVYLGTEDQLPDPTIEAVEGAGNVEAYRGVAYVVFTDLPLADYGNRLPLFSFETTAAATEEVTEDLLEPLRVYDWDGSGRPVHSYGDTLYTKTSGDFASGTDFETLAAANAAAFASAGLSPWVGAGGYSSEWVGLYRNNTTSFTFNIDGDQLGTDPETIYYHLGDTSDSWDIVGRGWDETPGTSIGYFVSEVSYLEVFGDSNYPFVAQRFEGLVTDGGGPGPVPPFEANLASLLKNPSAPLPEQVLSVVYAYPLVALKATRVPTHAPKSCFPGEPCAADVGMAELPSDPDLCISCAGGISINYDWVIESGTAKTLCDVEYRAGVLYQNALGPVLLPADPDYNNAAFWSAAAAAAISAGTMQADVTYPVIVSGYAVGTPPAPWEAAEEGTALLSDIVTDICARAGLTAIDAGALTDVVQGYKIVRQMSARLALEPLRQAFYFDAVENGNLVQFVKRGGSSVATIVPEALGAHEGAPPVQLVLGTRAQETELPAEVNVAYEVRDADYQTGVQQARRVTTGSQQVVGADLPIVMTDEKGAEVADVLMVDAWVGRTERKFSTTRAYTHLLPTDVVVVDDGEFIYTGRVGDKIENGPVIDWTMRDTAAATYSPNVRASITSGGGGSVLFSTPLRLQLMDVPALRDDDDNAGFYAATSGFGTTFNGGRLYKSQLGVDYSSILNMNVAATMGVADTVLGNFTGGNVVDEANTVTVHLYTGTLTSATRAQLLGGANGAVIGTEVLQFQRATLVGTNTWRLSGLLRGRRGTEQHIAGHVPGERFVLLDVGTVYRVPQNVAEIGTAYYRAVPYGGAVIDAAAQTFENTAAALKPLSPAHLQAVPKAGGGKHVQWVRRTRLGGVWQDYIDAPLSEASESYRVRVLNGATVVETYTVSSPSKDITSDTPGLVVEVVQMSATVGPGFPATVTLPI